MAETVSTLAKYKQVGAPGRPQRFFPPCLPSCLLPAFLFAFLPSLLPAS